MSKENTSTESLVSTSDTNASVVVTELMSELNGKFREKADQAEEKRVKEAQARGNQKARKRPAKLGLFGKHLESDVLKAIKDSKPEELEKIRSSIPDIASNIMKTDGVVRIAIDGSFRESFRRLAADIINRLQRPTEEKNFFMNMADWVILKPIEATLVAVTRLIGMPFNKIWNTGLVADELKQSAFSSRYNLQDAKQAIDSEYLPGAVPPTELIADYVLRAGKALASGGTLADVKVLSSQKVTEPKTAKDATVVPDPKTLAPQQKVETPVTAKETPKPVEVAVPVQVATATVVDAKDTAKVQAKEDAPKPVAATIAEKETVAPSISVAGKPITAKLIGSFTGSIEPQETIKPQSSHLAGAQQSKLEAGLSGKA